MSEIDFSIGGFNTAQQTDLTNCDREPIHIPGSIQPHGLLFVLQEPDLKILQVSRNCTDLVGLPPEKLLNHPLSAILDHDNIDYLNRRLKQDPLDRSALYIFTVKVNGRDQSFDGIAHRVGNLVVLELEPTSDSLRSIDLYNRVKMALTGLSSNMSIQDICQVISEQVRELTGFDRVMIYRFDENWDGEVIAESIEAGLDSYLGLHYPASDIPRQARALYTLNWLRLIHTVNYTPAVIVPTLNPATGQTLDMSYGVLRSVSPVHLEYLRNMGVQASMSISILKDGKLWGLVACHHHSGPRFVPFEVRTACELLGQVISLQLSTKQDNQDYEYRVKLKSTHSRLVDFMAREVGDFINGLVNYQPNLLEFISAGGLAVCYEDKVTLLGNTPPEEEIRHLVSWLAKTQKDDVFSTNFLAESYPEAENFKDTASGLLAIHISQTTTNYILWFRSELIQTVNWSGEPSKGTIQDEQGLRLVPRKSFEIWKQTVRLKSLPWKSFEVEAAQEMRNAIIEVALLRQAGELVRLNRELEKINIELDAFSYITSHDLKEPLRGIHNYSSMLLEDYREQLDEEGVEKLETLSRLTQRMEGLIDSLLHFSRVGRVDFSMTEVDLNELVHQVIDMLSARTYSLNLQINLPRPLPEVACDRVMIGEVFNNLITNAIKYNDKAEKLVEIGYLDSEENTDQRNKPIVFYVKDNGIGIQDRYFDSIFMIFKRLHGRDEFGGGTGAGLTITKKIIDRHGGKIWVRSTYGEGSTFYFTLNG